MFTVNQGRWCQESYETAHEDTLSLPTFGGTNAS